MRKPDNLCVLGAGKETVSAHSCSSMPDGLKIKDGRLRNRARRFGIYVEGGGFVAGSFCKISANIGLANLVCKVRFLRSVCQQNIGKNSLRSSSIDGDAGKKRVGVSR